MIKAISAAAVALVAMLAAQHPAEARRAAGGLDGVQFRQGMAAFDRHDFTRAGALLRLPAENGNPRAQAVLCFLYTHGRGVPQSYSEAAFWCHRSADQGNAEGQYLLGLLYNAGHGVPESYVQAYKWLNLAAAHATGTKRDYSYRIRDSVAAKMSPRQVETAQALSVDWRPVREAPGAVVVVAPCPEGAACFDR
jgi:TPR repeat protein